MEMIEKIPPFSNPLPAEEVSVRETEEPTWEQSILLFRTSGKSGEATEQLQWAGGERNYGKGGGDKENGTWSDALF